jgi:hypothetical protein
MKVLGISGGTKNGHNDAMCKEALMGAKEAGAEVEFIHLMDFRYKTLYWMYSLCSNTYVRKRKYVCFKR